MAFGFCAGASSGAGAAGAAAGIGAAGAAEPEAAPEPAATERQLPDRQDCGSDRYGSLHLHIPVR